MNVGGKAHFNQSNYESFWMLLKSYELLWKETNYSRFPTSYLVEMALRAIELFWQKYHYQYVCVAEERYDFF